MYRQHMSFRQKGAALVISLVLLTMLTTLGVTAMRSNLLDVRIHNNTKSKLVALQCAEAALLAGEDWIWNTTSNPEVSTNGSPAPGSGLVWGLGAAELDGMSSQDASWWASNGWPYGTGLSTGNNSIGCTQIPYYVIEKYGSGASEGMGDTSNDLGFEAKASGSGRKQYFRITAYGLGPLDTVPVVLQSTFAKPYN